MPLGEELDSHLNSGFPNAALGDLDLGVKRSKGRKENREGEETLPIGRNLRESRSPDWNRELTAAINKERTGTPLY